jgi:GT2 family glycosyltransferase
LNKFKVSIGIVNYNNLVYLPDCLSSVFNQTIKDIQVIIVDNNSTDGSVEYISQNYPSVKLIKNKTNEYFCRAHNQAIKESESDFNLVLNTDVVLEPDFLENMLISAELDERIGILSGKIMRMDKKHIDTAGLFLGVNRRPIERGYGFVDSGQYETDDYIFGAGGVTPLYRRAMLEDIKVDEQYFDERYEIYYEDLDISWRAFSRGWKAFYNHKALAYHKRGGTNKVLPVKLKYFSKFDFAYLSPVNKMRIVRNRYLTIIKNENIIDFIKDIPFIITYDLKIWLFILIFTPTTALHFFKTIGSFKKSFMWKRRIKRLKKVDRFDLRKWITGQV